MLQKIKESAEFLQNKTNSQPKVGIILGTGLGGLVNEIDIKHSISYKDIPNFPLSTVEGHSGRLIFGNLGGKGVVAMQGRFHFYEGYPMDKVTFPVRVMKLLGIENLLVSNASGGVNPDYEVGDLMILSDHINLIPNPLIGANITELGPRFPDMSEPYCKDLISKAESIAKANNLPLQKGVYVALTGPTLETLSLFNMILQLIVFVQELQRQEQQILIVLLHAQ
jgi:purine-nucleoside phosphorylase